MEPKKATLCVRPSSVADSQAKGLTTPIYTSTSFHFPGDDGEVYYPRYFNLPTHDAVADKIRQLEHGDEALVLGSGMAAITSVLLGLLRKGDHAVFHSGIYGGSRSFVTQFLRKYGIDWTLVHSSDPDEFASHFRPNTRLVYLESPTNPLLQVLDVKAIANLARPEGIISVVDNTFATPICQNPLALGADIVVHSGTKYLNGHSDVNCGAIVASKELFPSVKQAAIHLGGTLDVRACYLLERGMKTLHIRVERQCTNAARIAEFLSQNRLVRRVYYPGLATHPGHDIARSQMSRFGGMLAFDLNLDSDAASECMSRLKIATMAVSLGGVETVVCFPKDTSHASMTPDERREIGIGDTLIRVSAGIEDVNDLISDFEQSMGSKGAGSSTKDEIGDRR